MRYLERIASFAKPLLPRGGGWVHALFFLHVKERKSASGEIT